MSIASFIEHLLTTSNPDSLLSQALNLLPDLKATLNAPAAAHEAYSRVVLHGDARGEVLLMQWQPGMFCAPHDHAQASGFVMLLDGHFTERAYTLNPSPKITSIHHQEAPAWMPFEHGRVHDMSAQSGGISLHVYRPCITGMRVYDMDARRTLIVKDTCGAWVPLDTSLILREEPWPQHP